MDKDLCAKHNIGLIARVPLDEGGLTGKFTLDTTFEEGDFRREFFSKERLKELVKRVNDLNKLLGNEVKTMPELALRYVLSFDEISTVIPGMRKVKNVEINTAFSDGKKLSKDLMNALKNHAWERNFYPFKDPSMRSSDYLPV